jgi:methionine synthase II (cobalamin-independent)
VRGSEIESPEKIQERVESALHYVSAARITLNPDCGFAPSNVSTIPLDERT